MKQMWQSLRVASCEGDRFMVSNQEASLKWFSWGVALPNHCSSEMGTNRSFGPFVFVDDGALYFPI